MTEFIWYSRGTLDEAEQGLPSTHQRKEEVALKVEQGFFKLKMKQFVSDFLNFKTCELPKSS